MTSLLNYIIGIPTVLAQVSSSQVNQVADSTGSELAKLGSLIFLQIPLWIVAIIVGIASYLASIAVRRAIEFKLSKEGVETEHQEFQIMAGRIGFFGTLTLGITIALSIIGIDLKPIVAAGAFGVGFAMKDIISNMMAGMIILATRPFVIGDSVAVRGIKGRIVEIQIRATIIKDFNGFKNIIPNADMINNVVLSKTSFPFRKIVFEQGVGYGNDLKKVVDLTLATVNAIPWVLKKPKASIMFTEWDDSFINFKIKVWIDAHSRNLIKVKNAVIMDIAKAYDDANVYYPYPIQTVQLETPPKGWSEAEYDPVDAARTIDETTAKYKALGKERLLKNVAKQPIQSAPTGQSWLKQNLSSPPLPTEPSPSTPPIPDNVSAPAVTDQPNPAGIEQNPPLPPQNSPPPQTFQPETQPPLSNA